MIQIEAHGTSGRWYLQQGIYTTLKEAITKALEIKCNGYGVRILENGLPVLSAAWQEDKFTFEV